MVIDWGLAGQIDGIGFSLVFIVLIILAVTIWLAGVVERLSETAQNALINLATIGSSGGSAHGTKRKPLQFPPYACHGTQCGWCYRFGCCRWGLLKYSGLTILP